MRSALLVWSLIAYSPLACAQSPSLVGRWTWGAGGGTVEIDPNGAVRDPRGNTAQWTLRDAAARIYVLRWSHGYTDTATLAADGNSLTAVNNQGTRFTATRVAGAVTPTPAPAPGAGANIAGQWNWGAGGGIVEIDPGGTGRDPRNNTLKWILRDPATRTYTLTWSHGYTDTATLSSDRNTITAVNNQGTRFTATRRSGSGAAPVDLNGSWSNGLVHIWQDGAQVLATATWKRDDGKYVIWRGEGRLTGRAADLTIHYSPMPHGPDAEWHGILTVTPDGNTIDAVYSVGSTVRDRRTYTRDR